MGKIYPRKGAAMGFDDASLLYAEPSFFRGMGRAFDLGAVRNVYNDSPTPSAADMRAARSDWAAVGKDMKLAIDNLGKVDVDAQ